MLKCIARYSAEAITNTGRDYGANCLRGGHEQAAIMGDWMTSQQAQKATVRADDNAGGGGLPELRHHLAERILSRLRSEIPGLSAHFGEDYEHTDEPEALIYWRTGGTFRFLAFAFAPWRMWDFHVGVVPTTDNQLSIGFHVSERAAAFLMAELEKLGADIGATVIHQKAAVEYQANLPPVAADSSNFDGLVNTIADFCRRFAAVAKKAPCPPSMEATALAERT